MFNNKTIILLIVKLNPSSSPYPGGWKNQALWFVKFLRALRKSTCEWKHKHYFAHPYSHQTLYHPSWIPCRRASSKICTDSPGTGCVKTFLSELGWMVINLGQPRQNRQQTLQCFRVYLLIMKNYFWTVDWIIIWVSLYLWIRSHRWWIFFLESSIELASTRSQSI